MNEPVQLSLVTGVLALLGTVVTTYMAYLTYKVKAGMEEANEKIGQVHTIVNSQRSEMQAEIAALKGELSGIKEALKPKPSP